MAIPILSETKIESLRPLLQKSIERCLFILLFILLLASSVSIANGSLETTQTISIQSASLETTKITPHVFSHFLEEIHITPREPLSGSGVIAVVTTRPIDRFLIPKLAYRYFRIELPHNNINGRILFIVQDNWIAGNKLEREDISLYHFSKEERIWIPLRTTLRFSQGERHFYEAHISDTGYFVVAEKEQTSKNNQVMPKEEHENESLENTPNTTNEDEHITQTIPPETHSPKDISSDDETGMLLPIITSIVLIGTLIGGTTAIIYTQKKQKQQKPLKKSIQEILEHAEKKVSSTQIIQETISPKKEEATKESSQKETLSELRNQVKAIEPQIAQQFVLSMRERGLDDDTIRAELLQNHISYSVIQKIL